MTYFDARSVNGLFDHITNVSKMVGSSRNAGCAPTQHRLCCPLCWPTGLNPFRDQPGTVRILCDCRLLPDGVAGTTACY